MSDVTDIDERHVAMRIIGHLAACKDDGMLDDKVTDVDHMDDGENIPIRVWVSDTWWTLRMYSPLDHGTATYRRGL